MLPDPIFIKTAPEYPMVCHGDEWRKLVDVIHFPQQIMQTMSMVSEK